MTLELYALYILVLGWIVGVCVLLQNTRQHNIQLGVLDERDDKLQAQIVKLHNTYIEHNNRMRTIEQMIGALKNSCVNLNSRVINLTPDAILEALRVKESFLDRVGESIADGIATARNCGETAGENAAREMIRACLENAAAGKGPPLSILPSHVQKHHVKGKIRRIGDGG